MLCRTRSKQGELIDTRIRVTIGALGVLGVSLINVNHMPPIPFLSAFRSGYTILRLCKHGVTR